MTASLQKSQRKRGNILKKIKVEGKVDEGRDVIVCCKTVPLKWRGFESRMAIWNKIYEPI